MEITEEPGERCEGQLDAKIRDVGMQLGIGREQRNKLHYCTTCYCRVFHQGCTVLYRETTEIDYLG